jgi:hypothetical protein
MPTTGELRKRREKAQEREAKVDEAIRDERTNLERLRKELDAEREERDQYEKRRKELKEDLEAEIEADKKDKGEHPEKWEAYAEARRDELADMIEASEARIDRLIERVAKNADDLAKLRELDATLEKRIARIQRRIERKKDDKGQLTEHFHVAEFDCRDGTDVPDAAIPSLKALCENVLEPQRSRFGSVHVNSGYRTRSYNASIGGASNSIHIYDAHPQATAADHICASGGARAWFDNTAGKADGRGLYSSFHHADNRNRIGWPDATWSG